MQSWSQESQSLVLLDSARCKYDEDGWTYTGDRSKKNVPWCERMYLPA